MGNAPLAPPPVRFGLFEADLHAGELRRNGVRVRLQHLPFRALTLLLTRPGEVITRQEFRQALWPPDIFVDFEQGISSAVMRLRDALGDSADNPIFIETIERRGYRWIGPVLTQTLETLEPEVQRAAPVPVLDPKSEPFASPIGSGASFEPDRRDFTAGYEIELVTRPGKRFSRIVLWFATAIIAVLGGAGFLYWRWQRAAPISSIAILPFENLSAPAFDDAFSDGLTMSSQLPSPTSMAFESPGDVLPIRLRVSATTFATLVHACMSRPWWKAVYSAPVIAPTSPWN